MLACQTLIVCWQLKLRELIHGNDFAMHPVPQVHRAQTLQNAHSFQNKINTKIEILHR